eukprot:366552-Chlamydomonas_euryale.AAC.2
MPTCPADQTHALLVSAQEASGERIVLCTHEPGATSEQCKRLFDSHLVLSGTTFECVVADTAAACANLVEQGAASLATLQGALMF